MDAKYTRALTYSLAALQYLGPALILQLFALVPMLLAIVRYRKQPRWGAFLFTLSIALLFLSALLNHTGTPLGRRIVAVGLGVALVLNIINCATLIRKPAGKTVPAQADVRLMFMMVIIGMASVTLLFIHD